MSTWRGDKHDKRHELCRIVKQFESLGTTVQHTHPASLNDVPDRVQLGAVQVATVLAILQHLVTTDVILQVCSVNEPVPEAAVLLVTFGTRRVRQGARKPAMVCGYIRTECFREKKLLGNQNWHFVLKLEGVYKNG